VTAEEDPAEKESAERKRREVVHTFRTAPFEEIVARSEAKVCVFDFCPVEIGAYLYVVMTTMFL
jgi:hypothetical protein